MERRSGSPAFAASTSASLIDLYLARLLRFFQFSTGRKSWLTLAGLSRRRPSNSGKANVEIFRDLEKEISTFE